MRRTLWCLAVLVAAAAGSAAQQQKKRVAVLNFDYATVSTNVSAIFGTNMDVGKGVADLIVEKLVASGVYSVIERKAIDRVLAEQNFSNSDRADSLTAAKLGRVLGVDAIVIGSITQFGRDDKTSNIGGLGRVAGRYGLGGVGKRESKAVVGLSARVVSVDTGEILATAAGKGESSRSGATMLGGGGGPIGAGAGVYDMTSKNFGNTILGEAVNAAVLQVSRELDQDAARIPARTVTIEGLVADASGDTLVMNVGSRAGVKVGARMLVSRPAREIRDPSTGKVIRRIEDHLGEVVITEVDEASSVGKYTGAAPAKVGDVVKSAK